MKTVISLIIAAVFSQAHFLTLIPSTDIVQNKQDAKLSLDAMFIHPFEQTGMVMEEPKGIFLSTTKNMLPLTQTQTFGKKSWTSNHEIKRPGLYQFFVQPEPYFEPAEGKFISHVPKVIIPAFGYEDGWDKPLGLKYEIVPLTRPFGLYSGNIFTAKVLHNGKPASNVEVEVEFYNKKGLKAPTDSHITQVVKTNANGEFSFVMNQKGWWGFAALIEEGQKQFQDKMYPIENGALLWVKTH